MPNHQTLVPITDFHMHVIPGVDDGSTSMEMSMAMLRAAYNQGMRNVFATPHSDAFYDSAGANYARNQYKELKKRCQIELPDMNLYLGSEVYVRPGIMDEVIHFLNKGYIPTMNNTEYVLTEFSQSQFPIEKMACCLESLISAGYTPLLAHTERYYKTFKTVENAKKIKNMGCFFQINAYDIKEESKEAIREFTKVLLEEKLADCLGSDAHRMNHRPPKVESGVKAMYEMLEKEYAERILGGKSIRVGTLRWKRSLS